MISLGLGVGLSGCGGEEVEEDVAIEIVETVRLEMDGRPAFQQVSDELSLQSPHGLAVTSDGWAVSDQRSGTVFLIHETVAHVLGRSGSGPGEFRRPEGLWIGDGELVVYDGGNARVSRWELERGIMLEEISIAPEPGAVGTVARVAQGTFLSASHAADSALVRPLGPEDAEEIVSDWPSRQHLYPVPLVVDLISGKGDWIVVLNSSDARLVVTDGSGRFRFERLLPDEVVEPLLNLLEARRAPDDRTPLLRQFGRFLSVDSEGVALLVLIRPVESVVALEVELETGQAKRIEIPEEMLSHQATLREVTAMVRVGSCYLVGSSAGVQELCSSTN